MVHDPEDGIHVQKTFIMGERCRRSDVLFKFLERVKGIYGRDIEWERVRVQTSWWWGPERCEIERHKRYVGNCLLAIRQVNIEIWLWIQLGIADSWESSGGKHLIIQSEKRFKNRSVWVSPRPFLLVVWYCLSMDLNSFEITFRSSSVSLMLLAELSRSLPSLESTSPERSSSRSSDELSERIPKWGGLITSRLAATTAGLKYSLTWDTKKTQVNH